MNKTKLWLGVRRANLHSLSQMSTCLSRQVSAVLIKNNKVVSEGFNGAPCGVEECTSTGVCHTESTLPGHGLDQCIAVHAELNCILNAAKNGISSEGSTLICTNKPCLNCLKAIVNAGIKVVLYEEDYPIPAAQEHIYNLIEDQADLHMDMLPYMK